ncbi:MULTISPECIES: MTH1187 family thiamine-binding protein [unclassified Microbacterium]|uniref:thiamine-binding protein n=1 Tax=unclassified Microbacterium TaxID=2609290 RepID=UPI0038647210
MLIAFSVAPSGTGRSDGSVHDAVAAAVAVVRASGLPHRTSSMFTEVEGEWDEVMAVVKGAVDAVQPFGSRVSLVLKADIRPGYTGELDAKLDRLESAIESIRETDAGGRTIPE